MKVIISKLDLISEVKSDKVKVTVSHLFPMSGASLKKRKIKNKKHWIKNMIQRAQ